jgi:HD-GYP domain-containing protein (c-di-GMP phosphodiesterase class II)
LTIDGDSLEPIARMFGVVVDAISQWTATHSAGVAAVAVALAERYKFSPRELSLVRAAGYLHNLGKLTVPTEILDKSEGLTPVERNVLNGHTYHTFRILNTIGGMPQISEWAAFHRERLDGSGYPFHHAARDLTLGSRIMAVSDVFGAITGDRPYHKAMERDKVMSILNKLAGSNGLDGDMVHTLEKDYNTIYQICMDERLKYSQSQKRFLEKLQNFPALV